MGIMFYNDLLGAYAISPGVGSTNDGGQVMFTELQIVFLLKDKLKTLWTANYSAGV